MSEFQTYRCPMCGGVSHPSSGCAYSASFVVCGPCTRQAWKWILNHVNGKGGRKGINFYSCVNKISVETQKSPNINSLSEMILMNIESTK